MAKSNRKYFGDAYAAKSYRGAKSVNLVVDSENALLLAERLLKAVNAGKDAIDVRVNAPDNAEMNSGDRARITVTSRK